MLCIWDGRTHRLSDLSAENRTGLLRVHIHLVCTERAEDITNVRALLVGDVLFRALEARGIQVLTSLAGPQLSADQSTLLRHIMTDLGIHPPDDAEMDDTQADAHVSAAALSAVMRGPWIPVGAVTQDVPPVWDARCGDTDGMDPLAVRLALLSTPYRQPVTLTADRLADAVRTLRAWRQQVASWADSPSKPVPADIVGRADAALAEDLATGRMLDVLRQVETAETISDGAKFETFALLDRVLGLELTRDIGRV